MTVRHAIADAASRLTEVSDTPRLDAELLMAHALGDSRDGMLLGRLDEALPAGFAALVERRLRSEPVAYITGTRAFWTLDLMVNRDVLVPRPDTETLIEAAIDRLAGRAAMRVLDLGTGSGALLLAALDHWRVAWGLGVDRSAAAIQVAASNARRLLLHDRTAFAVGDWSSALGGRFDAIFCNPPYIATDAILPRDVALHEPASALFAGADGLDDYRRLLPQLPGLLAPGGYAFLETGAEQARDVGALAAREGMSFEVRRDLGGRERCVILWR